MANVVSLNVNDAVLVPGAIGVVLYIGPVHWAEDKTQIYVGLELTVKKPSFHNGTYDGHLYFICKPNQGIILKKSKIIRIIKPIELLHKLTELKQALVDATDKGKNIKAMPHKSTTVTTKQQNVSIHGVLMHENNDTNECTIQLKERNNIGSHSIIIPKKYVQITANSDSKQDNETENESIDNLKPLVLAPKANTFHSKNNNNTNTTTPSNRRRSSISGRKYNVTSRQTNKYSY